jgi:uncharacterized protein YbjT (DUF2867 family)
MMRVAVAGGTGTFGSLAAQELARGGHQVRVLSRHPPSGAAAAGHRRVDLATGEGLPAALTGVDVVVDACNVMRSRRAMDTVMVGGARRLRRAEAEMGVAHHVLISIVGIDRVPLPYYRVKLEQERALAESPVPAGVLRSTQFHQLVDRIFAASSRFGVVPSGQFLLQPVDPLEVARTLVASLAEGAWVGRREIAGPEVLSLTALARAWLGARGSGRLLVPVPFVGKAGRALRDGGLTAPDAERASSTFAGWLAGRGT